MKKGKGRLIKSGFCPKKEKRTPSICARSEGRPSRSRQRRLGRKGKGGAT